MHWLFFEAESFLEASAVIIKHGNKDILTSAGFEKAISLSYVSHVNHAFAFEMYIKCLMIIEKGEYHSGHNLFILFGKLSQKCQDNIVSYYKENYRSIRRHRRYFGIFEEVDFHEELKRSK
ncbi:MAG: hypothetical protein IPP72_13705 [Chitinophagaceae bacterium]|nr:hypothetical protein [Chitinophagaceae bacterium]